MARKHGIRIGFAVAVVAALGLALQAAPEPAREVRLEARGMAFYLEGSDVPNPAIPAAPGERLRLVLTNRDTGFEHDLRLPGLGRATRVLAGDGSSDAVVVRVPSEPGDHPYDCSLHARMMGGALVVR